MSLRKIAVRPLRLSYLIAIGTTGALACGGAPDASTGTTNDPIQAGASTALYVAPNGSGSACTLQAPCSLTEAQQVVRTLNGSMQGEIDVFLRGGTYTLTAPLSFTGADSGTGGHSVVWTGYGSEVPILSGGQVVTTPWALRDAGKNIWRTVLPSPIRSRQLYVNGVRAVRARGPERPLGFVPYNTSKRKGFASTDLPMSTWQNPSDIELTWLASFKMFRCGVASIAGSFLTMQQPCFASGETGDIHVEWIENARELLDEEGEFYLDSKTGELDYIPRVNESMSTANVVVPVLETLLSGTGTLDQPIHDMRFSNIKFEYATWLTPSTNNGYTPIQAGVLILDGQFVMTPGNVTFTNAHSVAVTGCTFTHLGGAGLAFGTGSASDIVFDDSFDDISGAAIELGGITLADAHPTDSRSIVINNLIQDNFVTHAGAEYLDAPGILAGYVESTTITHNDLFALPYSAISIGWGWGAGDTPTPAASGANAITWNEIGYPMRTLLDGGGIYTLGSQSNSIMEYNTIHDIGADNGVALYLDAGTQGYTVENNVLTHDLFYGLVQAGGTSLAKHNVMENNWYDAGEALWTKNGHYDSSNTVGNNTSTPWPALASTVQSNAGLESQYKYLHPTNLAYGKPVMSSSKAAGNFGPALANDEIAKNGWEPAPSDSHGWWQVDLGSAHVITGIEIPMRWGVDDIAARQDFAVVASNDQSFATYATLATQGTQYIRSQDVWSRTVNVPTAYRYVRVGKTEKGPFFLADVRVLGH